MCLGMANGYREPKKINETSNVEEVTKTLQRILEISNEPIGDRFFANITTKTIKDVLDVLTQQQAEIEDARIGVKSYKSKYESAVETARGLKLVIAEKQAEIDRLKNENLDLKNGYFQKRYEDNECKELQSVKEAWEKSRIDCITLNAELEECQATQIETNKKVFQATINKILSIKGHYAKIDDEFIEIESPEFLDELEYLFGMEFCEFNEDYEEKLEKLIKDLISEQKTSSATEEQLPTEVSQKISIYEFAEGLNGRQRGKEIYPTEKQLAKELGFVVVFGYSDDCAEFCGVYEEEVDCFDGGRVYEDGDKYIDAVWCGNNGYDWSYDTNIEHAIFDIYEDETDKYCRGIVFKK